MKMKGLLNFNIKFLVGIMRYYSKLDEKDFSVCVYQLNQLENFNNDLNRIHKIILKRVLSKRVSQ